MDNHSAPITSSSRRLPFYLRPWLIVLLVIVFTGCIRLRLLNMPLERDEGEYAYAGQLILQGIPPYELAYNMKLPGTYFAYAAGMAVFGQTIAGIHLLLLLANSLTIIFIFLLGRKLFGDVAGLVACASYGVMSVSPGVWGMAAHANHFVVLFAVPATWLLWKAEEANLRRTLFLSGLLYGMAFLMKQQGIFFGLFGWGFLIWRAAQGKSILSADFVKKSVCFGAGMILPLGLTGLVLTWAGVFSKFWFWTFAYARSYVTSVPLSDGIQFLGRHLKATFDLSIGFWLLAVMGLPLALRDAATRRRTIFVMVFWICSFLAAATGLYFRRHYFILVLPAFAVITGLAVISGQRALRSRLTENAARTIPLLLFAAVLVWNISVQKDFFFQMPADRVCRAIYPGNPFVESLPVAQYIREHSSGNARVAVVGSEPQIYFYAQRHSATGYLYTYALMESQPYALKMQGEMIREIESGKPEFLVCVFYEFSWGIRPDSDLTILRWFDQYAREFYDRVGIVDTRSTGETIYLWGDEARNYHGSVEQYLTVYKRRPAAETVPAKTN